MLIEHSATEAEIPCTEDDNYFYDPLPKREAMSLRLFTIRRFTQEALPHQSY